MKPAPTVRLLPWPWPADQSWCLTSGEKMHLPQSGDSLDTLKLDLAGQLLGYASVLLADPKTSRSELHFLSSMLGAALRDVLRIAQSLRQPPLPPNSDAKPTP